MAKPTDAGGAAGRKQGRPSATRSRTTDDSLAGVAAAMEEAAGAVRECVSDATTAPRDDDAQPRKPLARAVYRTCYYLAFGIVLPAVYLARAIPSDNAVVHGLRDGATSARRAVRRRAEKRAARGREWPGVPGTEPLPGIP